MYEDEKVSEFSEKYGSRSLSFSHEFYKRTNFENESLTFWSPHKGEVELENLEKWLALDRNEKELIA